MNHYPILYSLQHCPYAMRARMGIILARQTVRIRAIVLNNKPKEMLAVSSKGTVPVLVIENEEAKPKVIDESLDIMLWALKRNDPDDLLYYHQSEIHLEMLNVIETFDTEFKSHLENYKSAKRYHEANKNDHRQVCEKYIAQLEQRLNRQKFLMGEHLSLLDYAILPFIRQFARVERQWYLSSPYPKLKEWLKSHLESPLFSKVMAKHPLWMDEYEIVLFGDGLSS